MGISGVGKLCSKIASYRPSVNELSSANKGVRAILYGTRTRNFDQLGLFHLVTAGRFRNEIQTYSRLLCEGNLDDFVIRQYTALENSIPKMYANFFYDLVYRPDVLDILDIPAFKQFAKLADKTREVVDVGIMNPYAKGKSKIYFAFQKIKSMLGIGQPTPPKLDKEFLKKIFPYGVRLPENPSAQEVKSITTGFLTKCGYSPKEIKNVLNGKSPTFYRFIDETELRAIKNGHKIRSIADYNFDWDRTDITSDSHYNMNRYRVTFKPHKDWVPFSSDKSSVKTHDLNHRKFWLTGDYSKKDVLCAERVKYK